MNYHNSVSDGRSGRQNCDDKERIRKTFLNRKGQEKLHKAFYANVMKQHSLLCREIHFSCFSIANGGGGYAEPHVAGAPAAEVFAPERPSCADCCMRTTNDI